MRLGSIYPERRTMFKAPSWQCGNVGCSHRFSKAWHRRMAEEIERNAGYRMAEDFELAHPDPDTLPCDDCGMIGTHNHDVEH